MLGPRMESSCVGSVLLIHRKESALESGFNPGDSTMRCAGDRQTRKGGCRVVGRWDGAEPNAGPEGKITPSRVCSVHGWPGRWSSVSLDRTSTGHSSSS